MREFRDGVGDAADNLFIGQTMSTKPERRQTASMRDDTFDRIFNPAKIAMIGASASAEKAAGRRWKTLVEGGFSGPLYPIHPTAAEIRGHKAYPSIRAVPMKWISPSSPCRPMRFRRWSLTASPRGLAASS